MTPVLVDTDVLIDFLRGYPPAVRWMEDLESAPMVSVISLAELRAGMRRGEEGPLERLFDAMVVVDVDAEAARCAGDFRREFGPGHGTGLADALIAAAAITTDARLVTLNVRHYPMIEGLELPYRKA